jgi:ribosomal-protein-alanine N-acetyltransferase
MTASISSERLDLIPMTPAFLRASLQHNLREAEQQLQLSLPTEWPGGTADVLSLRLKQLEDEPCLQPWLLRAMALRGTHVMVGHIGFHTAPGADYLLPFSPEAVEFGFSVFPSFRRRGYAREASLALMHWARHTQGVTKFVLTIRPDNTASQALAAQLGFVRIGSHVDEVDGLEDVLEKVSDHDAV